MVAGNAFSQTVILTVDGINVTAVTLMVLAVSQPPVVLATVSMRVDGTLDRRQSMVAGNALVQTVILTVDVINGTAVTLIVLAVSQPPVVLATVSMREPGALNT